MNTKIISINNQKGGVGKTTTAISMAAALTKKGYRALLADCDGSSATLTKILAKQNELPLSEIKTTLTDMVMLTTMKRDISQIADEVIIHCKEGYDLIPADSALVSMATTLAFQNDLDIRYKTLKTITEQYKGEYDYILFDSAPVLDIFSLNQLIASDELIIVSQCQKASRAAIGELLKSVNQFVKPQNPDIKIRGILITMLDRRAKYGKEQIEQLKNSFSDIHIFDTVIPRSVEAERYVDSGNSLIFVNPAGMAAKAYMEFVREYLNEEARI